MSIAMTGFQLVAAQQLQAGEGLGPPNITANLTAYKNLAPVGNFSNIFYAAPTAAGLSPANAALLQNIGANSFPQLFGQTPAQFQSQLGTGPLFDIVPARTSQWFGVGVKLPQTDTPQFIPPPGNHYETQNVSIVCNTSDSNIYYTLDGSTPTANSSLYSNAIILTSNTTVSALATAYGRADSNIAVGFYSISNVLVLTMGAAS